MNDQDIEDAAVAVAHGADINLIVGDALTKLTRPQRDQMAADHLSDLIRTRLRVVTLRAERAAQRRATPPAPPKRPKRPNAASLPAHDDIKAHFDEQMMIGLRRILNEYKANLKVEWTRDLLDSTFGLGDGTLVTWGEATATQHADRLEMFKVNAVANIEGAARHEAALATLAESGASCLNAAVQPQAA